MYYKSKEILLSPVWNNALSYEQRKAMWSSCQLIIPALKKWTIDDLKIWNNIVFEEVDHKWVLKSCYGLESLLELTPSNSRPLTPSYYIIDNHNHALYIWYLEYLKWTFPKWTTVIHIDQHADMWVPDIQINTTKCDDIDYIASYTSEVCNVWNFIQPAIDSWLVKDVLQIRSVAKLLETNPLCPIHSPYILDIDIDFWVDHSPTQEEINAIHKLLEWASVCTVALSPYFMAIEKSIETTKLLFR